MRIIKMKFFFKTATALLSLLLLGVVPLLGQSQNTNRVTTNNESGVNQNYFFDQAGSQFADPFSSLDEFIDPDTYHLGPYDVLSIFGKGVIEFNYRGLTVNASGDLVIPVVGMVSVRGLTMTEVKTKIQEEFASSLKNSKVTISLDKPRPVSVHVGGEIPNPGKYIVQPGSRFSALISGLQVNGTELVFPLQKEVSEMARSTSTPQNVTGLNFDNIQDKSEQKDELTQSTYTTISKKYDLRRIQVTSNYGDTRYIDLSAYFTSGKKRFNPYIADGDQVNFIEKKSGTPTISISGAVINDFEGTFRTDDTFEKLFEISGGFTTDADSSTFIIYREVSGAMKKMEFTFGQQVNLQPNDRIIIPHSDDPENIGSVSINGQVGLPGIYSVKEGETTLYDLLEMAGGLNENALATAGYMYRESYQNRGVNSVSSITPSLLMRSSDQYLEGFDYLRLEEALNTNRMPIDFSNDSFLKSFSLSDGDKIFIPKDEQTVSVIGQINQPGFYTFNQNYTVSDYINSANGLSIAANQERIFIIKAGSRTWLKPSEAELSSGDIIFVDRTPLVDANSALNFEFQKEQLKNDRIQLILAAIGTITGIITTYVAVTR
jgi:protein involved in polysaccharide export with SLBB domain